MPKTLFIVLFVSLLIYLSAKLFLNKTAPIQSLNQKISDQYFSLDIANSSYLQAKGLSKRPSLCSNCGMIFIFNGESIRYFWMKDTLIPLDMIFVKTNGQVTDIFTANPEIGRSDYQLKIYQSSVPVKYVIELNADTSKKINLKVGDFIKIDYGN